MIPFLGVLDPGKFKRAASPEAPDKADFFGGLPDLAIWAVPLNRAEQDACRFRGKGPDPELTGQASFSSLPN